MKAVYLKAKNQFEVRDVILRDLKPGEVKLKVMACGFCGHDKILADYAAEDWQPFGHEFSAVVDEIGPGVENIKPGDKVVIQTSSFNPLSDFSLDGRPDLDLDGPSYMNMTHTAMGFAEYTIVPSVLCFPFDDISFEEASFTEPMGVAYDLIHTADIRLGNDLVIMGCGAIGLMALQMAKAAGARNIIAIERSYNTKKVELALEYGADKVLFSDKQNIEALFSDTGENSELASLSISGGVDRVLVTTPPQTLDLASRICRVGGIVAFLGIGYGPAAEFSLNSNVVHLKKLQIRASNAIPALYFPTCLRLMKAGMVDVSKMISHKFSLEEAPVGLMRFLEEKNTAVKALMVR